MNTKNLSDLKLSSVIKIVSLQKVPVFRFSAPDGIFHSLAQYRQFRVGGFRLLNWSVIILQLSLPIVTPMMVYMALGKHMP